MARRWVSERVQQVWLCGQDVGKVMERAKQQVMRDEVWANAGVCDVWRHGRHTSLLSMAAACPTSLAHRSKVAYKAMAMPGCRVIYRQRL